MIDIEKLKFPIGQFVKPDIITEKDIEKWIVDIAFFPDRIDNLTNKLSIDQLSWQYRPNGWTIRQLVHHCADSHVNMFIRFKLALTENVPVVKSYDQNKWVELVDSKDSDISASLTLIEAIHYKWVLILKSMDKQQWKKQFFHPGYGKLYILDQALGTYAWHCNHHLAHIEQAIIHKGNFQ